MDGGPLLDRLGRVTATLLGTEGLLFGGEDARVPRPEAFLFE